MITPPHPLGPMKSPGEAAAKGEVSLYPRDQSGPRLRCAPTLPADTHSPGEENVRPSPLITPPHPPGPMKSPGAAAKGEVSLYTRDPSVVVPLFSGPEKEINPD